MKPTIIHFVALIWMLLAIALFGLILRQHFAHQSHVKVMLAEISSLKAELTKCRNELKGSSSN